MIDSLAGVTIVTPDLDAAIAAYCDFLEYRAAPIEPVGDVRAAAWGAPGAAAARMAMLHPASGAARFIRLVEGVPDPAYRPLATYGWNAAEIVVQDVDRLADRLANSPFKIIGPPAILDFDFTDAIKAMQVEGPGGEILYLTSIGAEIPGFDLPAADSFVDQLFIMVLGAPDMAAAGDFYAGHGRPIGPTIAARIRVLSAAHGMSPDHRHSLATVALGDRSLIEVDAFPAGSQPRGLSSIGLPSGIAMVSMHGDGPAGMLVGTAGEWIELKQ